MTGRLLADIGGTNARFAWQDGPGAGLRCVQVLECIQFTDLATAARHWLNAWCLPGPAHAALAVACAVQSDRVQLTNSTWSFSIQALQIELQLERLEVVNDFTALALGLPFLDAQYFRQLGGPLTVPLQIPLPVALLGPGTGLGVSGLLPNVKSGWVPIAGEGVHTSLAVHGEWQYRVLRQIQARFGHVSLERVLSGQGLVNIYGALCALETGQWPEHSPTPAYIVDMALSANNPLAQQVLHLFCNWLGAAAGDLALTLGSTGGVFIGGGIPPRIWHFLEKSEFRYYFESKGRFKTYLQPLPVWVIDAPVSPALQGVASLLD